MHTRRKYITKTVQRPEPTIYSLLSEPLELVCLCPTYRAFQVLFTHCRYSSLTDKILFLVQNPPYISITNGLLVFICLQHRIVHNLNQVITYFFVRRRFSFFFHFECQFPSFELINYIRHCFGSHANIFADCTRRLSLGFAFIKQR